MVVVADTWEKNDLVNIIKGKQTAETSSGARPPKGHPFSPEEILSLKILSPSGRLRIQLMTQMG